MVSSCSPGWLETCYIYKAVLKYICLCSLSVRVEGVNHHGTISFQSQKVLKLEFCSSGGVYQQPQHSAMRGTVYQNSRLQVSVSPRAESGNEQREETQFLGHIVPKRE